MRHRLKLFNAYLLAFTYELGVLVVAYCLDVEGGAPHSEDEADVDAYIDECPRSFLHDSGSCRMAAADDAHAAGPGVVNDELRVHGVRNLRVCDANIFPEVLATLLQAPVTVAA